MSGSSKPGFAVTHVQKSKIRIVDAISVACTDQTSKVTYLKLLQLNFETDRSSLERARHIQPAPPEYSCVEITYEGPGDKTRRPV